MPADRSPPPSSRRGPIRMVLGAVITLVLMMGIATVVGIALESAAHTMSWSESWRPSERLATELDWMREDLGREPVLPERAGLWVRAQLERWGVRPAARALADHHPPAAPYLAIAVAAPETVVVRTVVLFAALPVIAVFALLGAVDGLIERDLRRWGGGHESSTRYDGARWVLTTCLGAIVLLWFLLPVPLHPSLFFVPLAVLVAVASAMTTARYKKVL